jgi:hypothetical protein
MANPLAFAWVDIACDTLGEIVEQSMSTALGLAITSKPELPKYKASTCREAGSMLIMTSASATASDALSTGNPPPALKASS